MSDKHDETKIERSRLTLLLGAAAAAGSGACTTGEQIAATGYPVSGSRTPASRSARAPGAASTPAGQVGARDPVGSGNGSDGGGGGGGY